MCVEDEALCLLIELVPILNTLLCNSLFFCTIVNYYYSQKRSNRSKSSTKKFDIFPPFSTARERRNRANIACLFRSPLFSPLPYAVSYSKIKYRAPGILRNKKTDDLFFQDIQMKSEHCPWDKWFWYAPTSAF